MHATIVQKGEEYRSECVSKEGRQFKWATVGDMSGECEWRRASWGARDGGECQLGTASRVGSVNVRV